MKNTQSKVEHGIARQGTPLRSFKKLNCLPEQKWVKILGLRVSYIEKTYAYTEGTCLNTSFLDDGIGRLKAEKPNISQQSNVFSSIILGRKWLYLCKERYLWNTVG